MTAKSQKEVSARTMWIVFWLAIVVIVAVGIWDLNRPRTIAHATTTASQPVGASNGR